MSSVTLIDPDTRYGYRAGVNPLGVGVDRSGTAGTTASTLAPANTKRLGLNIQNVSANTLYVNEVGGTAAVGAAGSYKLDPGASMNVRTNRAVSVIASAASSAFSATEF